MRQLYQRYMGNLRDRTTTTSSVSFSMNAVVGIGQLTIGLFLWSPWYIVNALYYLLLGAARGQALTKYKKIINLEDGDERYDNEFIIYKRSGLLICLLGGSYMGICIWMFMTGESRVQNERSLVIGVATVAFTKIGVAIYGMIVNRKRYSPIVSLLKTISFLDALVSLVITQCTLLTMSESDVAVSSSALFGMGVSTVFLAMGVYMFAKKRRYPEHKNKIEMKKKLNQGC